MKTAWSFQVVALALGLSNPVNLVLPTASADTCTDGETMTGQAGRYLCIGGQFHEGESLPAGAAVNPCNSGYTFIGPATGYVYICGANGQYQNVGWIDHSAVIEANRPKNETMYLSMLRDGTGIKAAGFALIRVGTDACSMVAKGSDPNDVAVLVTTEFIPNISYADAVRLVNYAGVTLCAGTDFLPLASIPAGG